jgi:hypothetical protein
MNFRSEAEIDHFLAAFDSGTMPRYCWTHAAHLAMCAARLWKEDQSTVERIRLGIQHYNHSQGTVTTPTSGYHETLTLFWIETVRGYLREASPGSRLAAVCGAIKTFGVASDLPRKRYTFDVFQSPEARARWIPPDRE